MFNPPGSYDDLLKRMTRRMQENKVDSQILEILQQAFEQEFNTESVVLPRRERIHLFQQVVQAVWADVQGKVDRIQ